MITRLQVDALRPGDLVEFTAPGRETVVAHVEDHNGCKVIDGTWLTNVGPLGFYEEYEYQFGQMVLVEKINTGYTEYVLEHGKLTVLETAR